MAKNKRKNSYKASNSAPTGTDLVVRNGLIQAGLTAANSLDYALGLSDWDCMSGYNQSLSPMNAVNNLSLYPLSLQWVLLTYLYKTYGILGKVVDIPVDDAYKDGGFDLEADTIDEKELQDLQKALVRQGDIKAIKSARKWARLFGGGALVAITPEKLSGPLNLDNLEGKALKFIAVDRWQLNYSYPNVNMRGGTWTLCQYQQLDVDNEIEIHDSRIFPLKGKEAPYLIEQQVQGWGISVYEQIFQDMSQFFKARNVLFELLDEAKTDVLKINTLQTALSSAQGERAVQKMVDFIARNKNYKSQITLSTQDDYDQKQISFAGFEGVLKEIRIMMSGSANMPVNKLWGEGVTGFGSGEDSLENYNSQIENEIRSPDDELIEWVLKLRCYQMFGREVEDLVKTWKNLRVLSAIDEQNITDHKLGNVLQLFDRKLLTPKEIMEYLKKQQIFIHDTKALRGELEDVPLLTQRPGFTEQKDITVD